MSKYLLVYRSNGEPMGEVTPEEGQAMMQGWMDWSGKVGSALTDMGAPLGPVGGSDATISGYSILEADSEDALSGLLEGHPIFSIGGTIDVHAFLPVPGM